jgi:hypothetical protein
MYGVDDGQDFKTLALGYMIMVDIPEGKKLLTKSDNSGTVEIKVISTRILKVVEAPALIEDPKELLSPLVVRQNVFKDFIDKIISFFLRFRKIKGQTNV